MIKEVESARGAQGSKPLHVGRSAKGLLEEILVLKDQEELERKRWLWSYTGKACAESSM